jgi:MoaA/NifB/PqqE/SkfB family radical SAM enzyme
VTSSSCNPSGRGESGQSGLLESGQSGLLQIALSPVARTRQDRTYFCTEPWTGILSIETNLDVTFCPCFLKMNIGNLTESSMLEVWNSQQLVQLRQSFSEGILPEVCQGQLCPVAVGKSI